MKKLNRKGFTLVELLAVIIILAIVVGISIPAVLTTTSSAKKKSFQSAADAAADWFDRQYQVALISDTTIATTDANFVSFCGATGESCTGTAKNLDATVAVASGLKAANIDLSGSTVQINKGTGRTCVILKASTTGDYANLADVQSSSCAANNND